MWQYENAVQSSKTSLPSVMSCQPVESWVMNLKIDATL